MGKSKNTFTCEGCGDSWPYDPRLIVPCPDCKARAGANCIRPSEHRTTMPHRARREAAFEKMPCSCLARWLDDQQRTQKMDPFASNIPTDIQPDLFAAAPL